MSVGPAREWAPGLALLALAALLPALVSTEYVLLGASTLVTMLVGVSFNLLFGYAGMFSFGQSAFYGVGAYATVLLLNEAGFDFWAALPAGVLAAALLAGVSGAVLVRLEPIGFIMLTFALADLLEFGAAHARSLTGGDGGLIANLPGSLNETIGVNRVYYAILAVAAVVLVAAFTFVRSRAGLVLRGIREDGLRAETLGIAVARRRLGVFALAGAVAGAAGGLSVLSTQIVYPSAFAWQLSAMALIVTLLGGAGLFCGPLIGAVALELIDFYVGRSSTNTPLIDGAVLLAIVLVAPRGLLAVRQGRPGRGAGRGDGGTALSRLAPPFGRLRSNGGKTRAGASI